MEDSQTPRVVTVGHVDHGKSSFIGRLMYELGQVTEEKFQELKNVSTKRGMEFEFAFLLDALQDERNQGITIDTTQIFFKTETKSLKKVGFLDTFNKINSSICFAVSLKL